MALELDMYVAGGVVVEKATASVEFTVDTLTGGREEAPFFAAQEVIDRYLLAWNQVAFFQDAFEVANNSNRFPRSRSAMLFAILACGTLWYVRDGAGSVMLIKFTFVLALGENTRAHQKLNLLKAHVAQSIVPSK